MDHYKIQVDPDIGVVISDGFGNEISLDEAERRINNYPDLVGALREYAYGYNWSDEVRGISFEDDEYHMVKVDEEVVWEGIQEGNALATDTLRDSGD